MHLVDFFLLWIRMCLLYQYILALPLRAIQHSDWEMKRVQIWVKHQNKPVWNQTDKALGLNADINRR